MTRKEAIADIKQNILPIVGGKSLLVALEALEERRSGKWITLRNGRVECSVCFVEQPIDSYFCPWCGAKMEGVEE